MYTFQIALEACLYLAIRESKKYSNPAQFLRRLRHALSSYELKGHEFLLRHRKKGPQKFLLETLFPLMERLSKKSWVKKKLLAELDVRLAGAIACRTGKRPMTQDDLNIQELGKVVLRKAISSL